VVESPQPKGSGVETWEELRQLVDGGDMRNRCRFFLTLNGPYYAATKCRSWSNSATAIVGRRPASTR
jgi:hypothetical protein